MLTALYEEHAADLRSLEEEWNSPWNRGAGSVSWDEVEQARESLERVVELQRLTSASTSKSSRETPPPEASPHR
ncbi:hypothetical protein [Nonomuraea sp. NPDC048826]|uniref:hypothetical protein n=1 Tax=Nonomuraea sp. NPDC048826 TaxID=3364347 RepID=UPI0037242961